MYGSARANLRMGYSGPGGRGEAFQGMVVTPAALSSVVIP